MKSIALPFLIATIAATAPAQSTAEPEVHPDGRVTFRLDAPGAREVVLRFESDAAVPMQPDARGVWSATTAPLAPDIYSYLFGVDGVPVLDPANPRMKYNLISSQSEVHVPGPSSLPWEIADVPRGVVHRHYYHSAVVGDDRDFLVYTPPGYDPAAKDPYPVLYLLHGFSDDATAWSTVGRANVILDNLIARGQAKPMLVVMPLGYGRLDILAGGFDRQRPRELTDANIRVFGESLLREVIPQVQASYRVAPDPAARAIAGLSMGGAEALAIGLGHPDTFAWIGAFSSGSGAPDPATLGPDLNTRLRLLWITCGRGDSLFAPNQKFAAGLTARGVKHVWLPAPGIHNFPFWRRNLADFVPLLFR